MESGLRQAESRQAEREKQLERKLKASNFNRKPLRFNTSNLRYIRITLPTQSHRNQSAPRRRLLAVR